jgi:hypothetical protein
LLRAKRITLRLRARFLDICRLAGVIIHAGGET